VSHQALLQSRYEVEREGGAKGVLDQFGSPLVASLVSRLIQEGLSWVGRGPETSVAFAGPGGLDSRARGLRGGNCVGGRVEHVQKKDSKERF